MYHIAIGCDPNAIMMKENLIQVCKELGHHIIDMGSEDPIYANTAFRVAESVVDGRANRGILICGTGIGMSIAANKVKGAYAALVTDAYSAERARKSNDTNIICFGALTLGPKVAEGLLRIWLTSEFIQGSPSEIKVKRIKEIG